MQECSSRSTPKGVAEIRRPALGHMGFGSLELTGLINGSINTSIRDQFVEGIETLDVPDLGQDGRAGMRVASRMPPTTTWRPGVILPGCRPQRVRLAAPGRQPALADPNQAATLGGAAAPGLVVFGDGSLDFGAADLAEGSYPVDEVDSKQKFRIFSVVDNPTFRARPSTSTRADEGICLSGPTAISSTADEPPSNSVTWRIGPRPMRGRWPRMRRTRSRISRIRRRALIHRPGRVGTTSVWPTTMATCFPTRRVADSGVTCDLGRGGHRADLPPAAQRPIRRSRTRFATTSGQSSVLAYASRHGPASPQLLTLCRVVRPRSAAASICFTSPENPASVSNVPGYTRGRSPPPLLTGFGTT